MTCFFLAYLHRRISARFSRPGKSRTRLTSDDIFMNDEVRRHYENLKDWIDNDPVVKEWDKKERFKHGFRVLFYGPPGTGKTLTANVLGNERGKHVYD